MILDYAILGFLNYKPFTGYELKKMFDTSIRHFWSADQSQIYRTLNRLTTKNLVEVEHVEQADRPDRKVYHITPAGQAAFLGWLRGPFPEQESRSAPLVQVFFSAKLSDEELLVKYRAAAELFRVILAQYEQVPLAAVETMETVPSPREHYFWMQTLDLGIRTMRIQLAWIEDIIQTIETKQLPEQVRV